MTPAFLERTIFYDPDCGTAVWKERPEDMFRSLRAWRAWNVRFSGKPVGYNHRGGYRRFDLCGHHLFLHRAVWAIFHGRHPAGVVDHINGNTTDNRIQNLRDVSHSVNLRNRLIPQNNTSGVMGVSFDKKNQNWRATIVVNGKCIHLGMFQNISDAAAARRAAESEHGFIIRGQDQNG